MAPHQAARLLVDIELPLGEELLLSFLKKVISTVEQAKVDQEPRNWNEAGGCLGLHPFFTVALRGFVAIVDIPVVADLGEIDKASAPDFGWTQPHEKDQQTGPIEFVLHEPVSGRPMSMG